MPLEDRCISILLQGAIWKINWHNLLVLIKLVYFPSMKTHREDTSERAVILCSVGHTNQIPHKPTQLKNAEWILLRSPWEVIEVQEQAPAVALTWAKGHFKQHVCTFCLLWNWNVFLQGVQEGRQLQAIHFPPSFPGRQQPKINSNSN